MDKRQNVYTLHRHCIADRDRSALMADEKKAKKKKDSQLVIRLNKDQRDQFVQLCDELDTSAARELRLFIKGFIARHKPEESA